jgi:periplasmic protein CpxP/Spy
MRNLPNIKWILLLLGILIVANISLLLGFFVFGSGHGDPHSRKEDGFKVFSGKMHLTPEQDKSFRAMKENHFDAMKPLWEAIRMTKDSLYRELGNGSGSDSLAEAYAIRLSRLNHESDMKTFHHFQEVRKLCTPEQQAIFDTLIPHIMTKPWNGRK